MIQMTEPLTTLKALAAEDAELAAGLVELFLAQAPEFMLDMTRRQQARDFAGLKVTAHTFKGVALNLGFVQLGQALKALELAAVAADSQQIAVLLHQIKQEFAGLVPGLRGYRFVSR